MSFWPKGSRSEPYTEKGIKRLKCVRCGKPAVHQWSICAEGNNFRPLCLPCDIELNKLVLKWARHPKAKELGEQYEKNQGTK